MARVTLRRQRESPIETWVVAQARANGIESIKLQAPYGRGETSYPDRQFFVPGGRPLLIEFKRPGDDPDPKQEYIHGLLRTLGYDVQVHDNRETALEAIFTAARASNPPVFRAAGASGNHTFIGPACRLSQTK